MNWQSIETLPEEGVILVAAPRQWSKGLTWAYAVCETHGGRVMDWPYEHLGIVPTRWAAITEPSPIVEESEMSNAETFES